MPSGDETLPLGDPPIPEHQTQSDKNLFLDASLSLALGVDEETE
jgi:hypothetical protein